MEGGLQFISGEDRMPTVPGSRPQHSQKSEGEIVALIPALRAFARTFYRNPVNADDLVQETLTRALAGIHGFQPGTSMKSWLFTIMRNTFYTQVKIANREQPGAADCISARPASDATQEWSARGREIARAIDRLPDDQRRVLVLIGVLGISYEEAAEICDCAVGTVKSRLHRARNRLLAELGERSTASSLEQSNSHPVASLDHLERR
jgi:RNA polymerase sigma-70 factor (ECF subfamily)